MLHAYGNKLDLTRMQEVSDQDVQLSLAPYPHWIVKECVEQPKAIAHAMGFGGQLTANNI